MSRRAKHNRNSPPKPRPESSDHTVLIAALRQVEIAVDAFNREAARIEADYGIAITPERVVNTPDNTGLAHFLEDAVEIVARKLPVAASVSKNRRWTGAQPPQLVIALHRAAGDSTADYLMQMASTCEQTKTKKDDLDRSLKTICGRPKKNGDRCQSRPLYQADVGHRDGFGCRHHVTAEELRALEQSRTTIEGETSCPGCRALPGEACYITSEGGLTPADAGLTTVDGEWPRVRALGGVGIHVPRIELVHSRSF